MRAELQGSLLLYIKTFFKILTGREFTVDLPSGREAHVITLCKELTDFFYLKTRFLAINIPPGHYKSTLVSMFLTWAYTHHNDCNNVYISNSLSLAQTHTSIIRAIMQLPEYYEVFELTIDKDSKAKGDFRTTGGGAVKAFGSEGAIIGTNAGYPHAGHFSGCVVLDDIHKPIDMDSPDVRNKVINNYKGTVKSRLRGENVGILAIGQRLHEADFFAFIEGKEETFTWRKVVLPAIDAADNVLAPNIISRDQLMQMKEKDEYNFWAMYQQRPQPAGGSIFKEEWFTVLYQEPEYLETFITVDTAETDKTQNDATVFSLWGLYELEINGRKIGQLALHWLDCWEIWVQPFQLKSQFMSFYQASLLRTTLVPTVAVEKKSTGVTLLSMLEQERGMKTRTIERNISSGCKIQRFRDIQPYINSKLVSFPANGKHNTSCIEHCAKITGTGAHLRDDIADTLYDAVNMAQEKEKMWLASKNKETNKIYENLLANHQRLKNVRVQNHYAR